jgi:excisionase family DNA binding protein
MADNDLADDVLNGMTEICRYLNIKERQGYELAETGRLPLFKLGGRKWQGRKSTLRKHIEGLEAKGAA